MLVGTFLFRYHFAGKTPTVFFFGRVGGAGLLKKKVNKIKKKSCAVSLNLRKTKTRKLRIIRKSYDYLNIFVALSYIIVPTTLVGGTLKSLM